MKEFFSILFGIFIGVAICNFFAEAQLQNMRKEAVRRGAAVWAPDEYGKTRFIWKN